jgi:hypothetical protein
MLGTPTPLSSSFYLMDLVIYSLKSQCPTEHSIPQGTLRGYLLGGPASDPRLVNSQT